MRDRKCGDPVAALSAPSCDEASGFALRTPVSVRYKEAFASPDSDEPDRPFVSRSVSVCREPPGCLRLLSGRTLLRTRPCQAARRRRRQDKGKHQLKREY